MIDGLFRESAGRMVSTLTRILGARHLELAEECVQDALIRAMETWPFHGTPANPQAWLIQTARNRAVDRLRRDQRFVALEARIPELEAADTAQQAIDDELGMIFLCCRPGLSRESQVALVLKTVCGLGVKEIARAYLTQDATIAQRLVRAKRQIREQGIEFDLLQAMGEVEQRLDAVLESLYLLFNEGYTVGFDTGEISTQAIRLGRLLVAHPATARPECHALLALMLLQSARDPARIDSEGGLNLLEHQDRGQWDKTRIGEGMRHLDLSAHGSRLTRYHLEAGIASVHATARDWASTDWRSIEQLYEALEAIHSSPVVRLNRAIASAQVHGPARGLQLLEEIGGELSRYAPYHGTMGLLCERAGAIEQAIRHYRRGLETARTDPERVLFRNRIAGLSPVGQIPFSTRDIH